MKKPWKKKIIGPKRETSLPIIVFLFGVLLTVFLGILGFSTILAVGVLAFSSFLAMEIWGEKKSREARKEKERDIVFLKGLAKAFLKAENGEIFESEIRHLLVLEDGNDAPRVLKERVALSFPVLLDPVSLLFSSKRKGRFIEAYRKAQELLLRAEERQQKEDERRGGIADIFPKALVILASLFFLYSYVLTLTGGIFHA